MYRFVRGILRKLFLSACYTLFFVLYFLMLPYSLLDSWVRRKMHVKPRIIWGPTPIINIATNSAADRKRGYKSDTLVYETYSITHDFTYVMEPCLKHRYAPILVPLVVFLWACVHYDIFQFYFDGGFLSRMPLKDLELRLLRYAGKRVVVSCYGADVRVRSITEALGYYNVCKVCNFKGTACICDEERARKNVEHVRRYAHALLSMGDMIEYVPGSRRDIFFWAIDLSGNPFIGQPAGDEQIVVVHAPNHPEYKGTKFLVDAVEALKKEGFHIDLRIVQKLSNNEALEQYKKAHIIFDQCLAGWYGFFAVEAMTLGKPVISFIRKPEEYLPQDIPCPIVNSDPDGLKDALRTLLEQPELRKKLGEQGRHYVERVHSSEAVGEKMEALYKEMWL